MAFVEKIKTYIDCARRVLIASQQRQKAFADRKRVEKTYAVENEVLIRNLSSKFQPRNSLPRYHVAPRTRPLIGSRYFEVPTVGSSGLIAKFDRS
jgi:hypothetical protein